MEGVVFLWSFGLLKSPNEACGGTKVGETLANNGIGAHEGAIREVSAFVHSKVISSNYLIVTLRVVVELRSLIMVVIFPFGKHK